MDIHKERFVIIGKLIGIYREELRNKTQNEYTQKRFCENICSPNTLKSIEAGGLSRFKDVYVELLAKLDLQLGEFEAIDEALDQIVKELYIAIEFFDRSAIKTILHKALRLLNKVKSYVYYSEIYTLFKNTQEYYLNIMIIEEKTVLKYITFIQQDVFPFKDLFRILAFANIQHIGASKKKEYLHKVKMLNVEESHRAFIKIILLHYYYARNDFVKMNKLIGDIEEKLHTSNNYIRLIDVYNYALILHSYMEKDKLSYYVKKIENLIQYTKFPEIKVAETYSNIASTLYIHKNYKEALDYFNKMLDYYNNGNLIKLLYMVDCQNHLGIDKAIPQVEKAKYESFPLVVKLMYKYFTLEKETPYFIKEDYIMKRILPLLEDSLFIEVMRFELNKLVEQTNHYKNIYLFNKALSESK